MSEPTWDITPIPPVELTIVPCQPAFDEFIKALGIPAHLLRDENSNCSSAGIDAMRMLEREHRAWLEIQRRREAGEEW